MLPLSITALHSNIFELKVGKNSRLIEKYLIFNKLFDEIGKNLPEKYIVLVCGPVGLRGVEFLLSSHC